MANIRPIYEDASKTTQLYPQTHERAVIDSNGTTAETKFQMITDLVNQKQMEIGAVPSDLTPKRGSTNWVASDGLAYSKLGNAIDFSKLYSAPFYLYNGKWNSNNGVNIFVKHINVYAGEKYCIVANSSLKADLRFMSTYYPVANAAATWTRQYVEAGKTEDITIPEGCNYLVFQDDHAQSVGSTILPDTVYKIEDDGINSTLNKHTEEISQLQDVSTVYETLAVYGGGNASNANKVLIVNGTLYSQNNYYSSDFIEIPSEATNVIYSGMVNNYHDNSCGFMLADSNYNVIWFATDITSGNGNIDLTNYTNAVYFRFCHVSSSNCYVRFEKRKYNTGDTSLKRGGDNVVINDGIAKMIPHIEENYYELEVNRCLVVADSTAQNFGELAPNTNTGSYYRASSYIYVEGATVIKNLVCVTKSNDNTLYGKAGYVFYDAEKTPISGVVTVSQGNYAQETRDVIVPDNAVYFRHTFNVTSDLIRITIEFKESENSLVVNKRDCDDLFKGDIIKTDVYRNTLEQLAWYSNPISGSGYKHKPLNLLHFSDIHGDGVNLNRIIEFKNKYSNYIDDVLHTGDSINFQWSNTHQFDFWLNTEGSEYILNTIGNHDTYNGSNWYAKTAAESYATYISPFVSNWDVEASENLCYYYKDYSDRGVRLIVIDVMHWDAAQLSWLETTLAGAKTNSLHVIIAGHAPAGVASNGNKECNFDYFAAQHNLWEVSEPYGHMDASVSQAVNTFIQGGGVFICYLCGHVHTDLFRRLDAYPEQYYIAVTLGACIENVGDHAWGCVSRHTGFRSQDLFNIITIDVANNLLTITRIGNEYDRFGRHQGGLLWDYGTREILFQY